MTHDESQNNSSDTGTKVPMTHDELLAIVSTNQAFLEEKEQFLLAKGMSALRAVVELHKPVEGHEHLCSSCLFGDFLQAYPCLTIQAIEKELG